MIGMPIKIRMIPFQAMKTPMNRRLILSLAGITRFLAIFARGHTAEVSQIGPVRSARPYYLDWTEELNAMFVHIGGSPQALTEINKRGIFDLNQFFNSQYFWTDKSLKTAIEHPKFTSLDNLIFP